MGGMVGFQTSRSPSGYQEPNSRPKKSSAPDIKNARVCLKKRDDDEIY